MTATTRDFVPTINLDMHQIVSAPYQLWRAYVDHLVYYQPGSWVASTARTFRILAALCIMPFAFLTLIDVTSYVIARTLGVIDDTKASTSDRVPMDNPKTAGMLATANPTILVSDVGEGAVTDGSLPTPTADEATLEAARKQESQLRATTLHAAPDSTSSRRRAPSVSQSPYFFSPHEERSLKLSGVGVFSPVVSRPPSPAIDRKSHVSNSSSDTGRTRAPGETSWQDTLSSAMSVDSTESFTMIEEEEADRGAGGGLRHRTPTSVVQGDATR